MRIRGATTELVEAGLDADNMATSTAKLREEIMALSGVDIMENESTFKSTYKILEELASKWQDLTDIQQASITELIAGKRQGNIVSSLMNNFDIAKDALATSLDSEGSALREHEKWEDSLEAKTKKLKVSLESLSQTFLNTDLVKNGVDQVNELVGLLEELIKTFGLLPFVAGGASAFKNFGIFKTMTSDANGLNTEIGILNASFKDIASSFSGGFSNAQKNGKSGLLGGVGNSLREMFSTNLFDENDTKVLTEYNKSLQDVNKTEADRVNILKNGSSAAQTAAASTQGGTVALKSFTLASIGAKAATIALNMALSFGLAVAIQGAISGISYLINKRQEDAKATQSQADKSSEEANNLREETKTIDELISKYKELASKNVIDVDTRNEIKNIQEQITELVGTEVRNLDLVNGKLDQQIEKLNEIKQGKVKEQSDKDLVAYNDAIKNSEAATGSAQMSILEKNYEYVGKQDHFTKELSKKYGITSSLIFDDTKKQKFGIDFSNYATQMNFKSLYDIDVATIEGKIEALKKIKKDIEDLPNDKDGTTARESSLWTKIGQRIDYYEGFIDENKKSLNTLLDSKIQLHEYDESMQNMEIKSVDDFEKYRNKLIKLVSGDSDISSQISKGILPKEDINNNVDEYLSTLDGFYTYYQEWVSNITNLDDIAEKKNLNLNSIFGTDENGNKNKEYVKDNLDKINELKDTLDKLNKGDLSKTEIDALIEKFPELKGKTDVLNYSIRELMDTYEDNVQGKLGELVDTTNDVEQLDKLSDEVDTFCNTVGNMSVSIDIGSETTGFDNLFTAISESTSATGISVESLKNLKARYQSLEGYSPEKLFEKTANGIHLNTKELRELEHAYEQQKKSNIKSSLQNQVEGYNALTKKINECTDAKEKENLYSQRNEIKEKIDLLAEEAAQYEGLTSAFNKWQKAQETNDLNKYESILQGKETIDDQMSRGWLTDEGRAYVDLLSNKDLAVASAKEIIDEYSRLQKKIEGTNYSIFDFFTQDEDGNSTSEGVYNFLDTVNKLIGKEASWKDDQGNYHFDLSKDKEVADKLKIDVEAIQAILEAADAAGFDIVIDNSNLAEGVQNLEELSNKAEEANQKLIDLNYTDYRFNFDVDSIDEIDKQLEEAKIMINALTNEKGIIDVGVDKADYDNAMLIIDTLIAKKQSLDDTVIMRVDTSKVADSSSDIEQSIKKLQNYKNLVTELETKKSLGLNTNDTDQKIQTALDDINKIPKEIKTILNIDTSDTSKLNETIAGISPELLVKAGLDASQIDEYTPENKYGTAIYSINTEEIDRYKPPYKDGYVNYHITESSLSNMSSILSQRLNAVVNKSSSIGGRVDGTAHANGTAFAQGNWGLKNSGIALGGELGEEIVVRDGKFFTIGGDSAEFFKYKPQDIIFNAAQTSQIFKYGKIKSGKKRGDSYVDGTAFSSGSGLGRVTISGSVNKTNNSKSNSDSSDKDSETVIDWIEVAISRIERVISNLDKTATNAFKKWSTRNNSIKQELSEVANEISIQNQGYNAYMAKANSLGLSGDWVSKIQNGSMDISTVTDEDLSKKINQYKDYYEKALACADAVEDLKRKESELYKSIFDNVAAEYDAIISGIEHTKNMLDKFVSRSEAQGKITSTKYYDALIKTEVDNIDKLEEKKIAMTKALNDAVSNGAIEKYSQEWYSMCNSINEVTQAIEEGKNAIIEYQNSIREIQWQIADLIQSNISQLSDEADFLISLMSHKKLTNEDGSMTEQGQATLGLHGMKYNTYMEQSMKYAQEIKKLDAEIAKDPYNQDLINRRQELIRLQRESILGAEDEKEAIKDLVQQGINAELDALKKLIDEYNKALDSQKSLWDYEKKVKDQAQSVADLQKQLTAWQGESGTEEGRAKVQELKKQLEDAQDNLKQTEYEKYISDQKTMLDELYTEYEEILNQRLDNLDSLVADVIGTINDNSSSIAVTIGEEASNMGIQLSEEMVEIWNSENDALGVYTSNIVNGIALSTTAVTSVVSSIGVKVDNMITKLNEMANTMVSIANSSNAILNASTSGSGNASSSNSSSSGTGSTESTSGGWGSWFISRLDSYPKDKLQVNTSIVDRLKWKNIASDQGSRAMYYSAMGGSGRYTGSDAQNIWMLNQMKAHGYKSGHYNLNQNEMAWTQENGTEAIIRPGDGAILTPLARNDSVLNSSATSNLFDFANNPSEFIKNNLSNINSLSPNSNSNGISNNNYDININLPNVENYEQFKYKMQRDTNFEKMIQSMTVGKMFNSNSNSLNKYKY